MDEKTIARFWSHVDRNGPVPEHVARLGPCWVWQGVPIKRGGYGQFGIKNASGKWGMRRAHRVAWEITNGPLTEEQHALHMCDRPLCVNPAHLRIGNQSENMADMRAKKREAPMPILSGRRHPKAVLTDEMVSDARRRYSNGETVKEMAEEYGVGRTVLGSAVHGRSWRHVVG